MHAQQGPPDPPFTCCGFSLCICSNCWLPYLASYEKVVHSIGIGNEELIYGTQFWQSKGNLPVQLVMRNRKAFPLLVDGYYGRRLQQKHCKSKITSNYNLPTHLCTSL
eukprot:GHVT01085393.1.p1 GENE.GHVT01085393.1~~GHVT01085393.1.p1  ORF type:complete len:108 (+),score=3.86 GHVT01085393.1:282-605(+)